MLIVDRLNSFELVYKNKLKEMNMNKELDI